MLNTKQRTVSGRGIAQWTISELTREHALGEGQAQD